MNSFLARALPVQAKRAECSSSPKDDRRRYRKSKKLSRKKIRRSEDELVIPPQCDDGDSPALLSGVPIEVLNLICLLLPSAKDVCSLCMTSGYFRDYILNDDHLWKQLYRIHIDPNKQEIERSSPNDALNWRELFKLRYQMPRWCSTYKHEDVQLGDNELSCSLAPGVRPTDRTVRISKPISALGVHFIEFEVCRGPYHTLFGLCDRDTADCTKHQRPWNTRGNPGVSCCWASDGVVYYGSTPTYISDKKMQKWKTGDRVGMLVTIHDGRESSAGVWTIHQFAVQFFHNGNKTGGEWHYKCNVEGGMYVVACLYGEHEKLTIVSRKPPHDVSIAEYKGHKRSTFMGKIADKIKSFAAR